MHFSAKQNRFKWLLDIIYIALKQLREWLSVGYCLSCFETEMRATEVTVNLPAQFAEDFEQVAGGGTVWPWGAVTAQLGCSRAPCLGKDELHPLDTFYLAMLTLTFSFFFDSNNIIFNDAKLFHSLKDLTHGPSLNVPKQPLRWSLRTRVFSLLTSHPQLLICLIHCSQYAGSEVFQVNFQVHYPGHVRKAVPLSWTAQQRTWCHQDCRKKTGRLQSSSQGRWGAGVPISASMSFQTLAFFSWRDCECLLNRKPPFITACWYWKLRIGLSNIMNGSKRAIEDMSK